MATDNNVKITIEYGVKGKKTIQQAKKDITALGEKTTKANTKMQHGMSSTMGTLESLGNRFRYLSLVVGTASVVMVTGISNFTQAAMQAEEAMLGLSAEANAWGRDFGEAEQLVQKMTDSGLIPFNKAAMIVRNIMGTGLDIKTTERAIDALMDRAVVAREAQYGYADAILRTSEGMRYNREQLADATLIQGLFNLAIEDASKATGKTASQLTKLEKAYSAANVIIKESERYTGMTENAQQLLVGSFGRVSAAVFDLKKVLGDALKPIIGPFADLVSKLSKALQFLVEHMSGVVGMTIMTTAVMTGLLAILATVGAILPMLTAGFAGIKAMLAGLSIASGLATMSLSKFALISMGITAGIAILTYTVLKLTGAWDRYANGFKNVMKGMQGANDAMKSIGKVHTEVTDSMSGKDKKQTEEQRIQHQRRLEDLNEELKREQSKGLWADQIKIKDLKKRIKRENEDWNRYLSDKESGQEDMSQTIADLMNTEAMAVSVAVDKMKMTWKDYIFWLSQWETWRDTFETIKKFFRNLGNDIIDGVGLIGESWSKLIDHMPNWTEVYEASRNIGLAFSKGVLDEFNKLPDSIKSIFGGITTYLLITWVPGIVTSIITATGKIHLAFVVMQVKILRSFAAIRTAWIGLSTTISTPIAIAIVVTGALYALQKIRDQITGLKNDIDGLSDASKDWSKMMKDVQSRYERGEITLEQYQRYMKSIREGQAELNRGMQETEFGWSSIWKGLTTPVGSSGIINAWNNPSQYAEGGVVPGPVGAPQPAIVHGGETIIPSNQSAITINIQNPIIREKADIQRIADAVSQAMGQKAKWARMGA